MDLFTFVAWVLVTISVITLIWPLNIPLLALACKVRQGTRPLDYEPAEFWWRCTGGTLGLAALSLLLLGLNYGLVVEAELMSARGIVQLVLLMIYLAAATTFLFWILALEDFFQALAVFLLYVGLPALLLLPLALLFRLGPSLAQSAPWLLPPS